MNSKRAKKYVITFLKVGLALALVWYLFKSGRLTKGSFMKLLDPGNALFLIIAGMVFLVSQALSSLRLTFLLRMIDITLKFAAAFKLTMLGNFYNMVIPGSVGGDVVKGYYLAKAEDNAKGRSSGIVIMDRVIGLVALLLIGGVSLIYILQLNSPVLAPYRGKLGLVIALSAVVSAIFVLLLALGKNRLVRQRLKALALKVFKQGFFYYMIEGLGAVTRKRRYLVFALLISFIVQFLSLAGIFVLSRMLGGAAPETVPLMAVTSVVMLFGVVPVTPGNLGWTELVATFGWSAIGSGNGAEIFFYWRIVTLLCSLPWGLSLIGGRSVGS